MSTATRVLIINEIRALLPAWLACLVAMVLPGLTSSRVLGVGIAAYVVGAAVLGSQVIGREYTNRTLASLLTLPVSRNRVLLTKLAVLAGMLAILFVVADTRVFAAIRQQSGVDRDAELKALLWVPVLSALWLAPWLTMLCRSALAGAVFSMVLPGLVQVAASLMPSDRAAEAAGVRTFWIGCLMLCAAGALMTWRTFARLDVVDGGVDVFSMPADLPRRRSASAPVQPPLWQLLKKEIRLQQMAFVVTAGYLLMCLITIVVWPRVADDAVSAMSFLYAAFIPPLVGSVASAEERQLGTLDWQLLLPIATWKQWVVKATVAFALAIALSLGLPAALLGLDLDSSFAFLAIPVLVATGVSLYISSLWSNAVWAFLTTVLVTVLAAPLAGRVMSLAMANPHQMVFPGIGPAVSGWVAAIGFLLLAACMMTVLGFGLTNHRSVERNPWRVVRQLAALSSGLVLALAAWVVVTLP
jgi:hypothetical protein